MMGKRIGKWMWSGEVSGISGGDQKAAICLSSEEAVEKGVRERWSLEEESVEL